MRTYRELTQLVALLTCYVILSGMTYFTFLL